MYFTLSNHEESTYQTSDMYFPDSFLSRFLITEWNVYDRIMMELPRTNNPLEALNMAINKSLAKNKATIWDVIEALHLEESGARLKMAASERGDSVRQQKIYKDSSERLYNLADNYEKDWKHRKMEYLEKVQRSLKKVEVAEAENVEPIAEKDTASQ